MGLGSIGEVVGGMEFRHGRPIHIPALPEQLHTTRLQLSTNEKPIVRQGDTLRAGQALTEPTQPQIGYHISPMAGSVAEICRATDSDANAPGQAAYRVAIDPSEKRAATSLDLAPPPGRDPTDWFEAIRRVGDWTTPPGLPSLVAQLHAAMKIQPDLLVCIGADAFAPFPDRSSLLASFAEEAVLGTQLIADIVGATNVVMLVSKHAEVVGRVRRVCQSYRMKVATASNVYPAADPTILANRCVRGRRRLRPRSNPLSEGVMMIEPWSAIRLGRWFNQHRVVVARPMMIAWPERSASLTACYAYPGQPLATLDQRLTDLVAGGGRLIAGNPMTGHSLRLTEAEEGLVPTVVPDGELLLSGLLPMDNPHPEPCINCGWCHEVCPTRLRPADLLRTINREPTHPWLVDQLSWCIDCGLCSHVCPSSLPLAQTFRKAF